MIEDIIKTEGTADDFLAKREESNRIAKAEQEAKQTKSLMRPETTMFSSEGAEALLRTNIAGYAKAEEALGITKGVGGLAGVLTTMAYTWYKDSTAPEDITIDEKYKLLEDNKIKPEDIPNFENINNKDVLTKEAARYTKFTQAEDTISRMPISEAIAGGLMASAVDLTSWAIGLGLGKTFTMGNSAFKMSKMATTALLTTENAAAAALSIGASEALLRMEHNTQDSDKVLEVMAYGAAFGTGISLLPSAFIGVGSVASQAVASKGVQNMLNYKDGAVRRFFTFNATDSVKLSPTATPLMKEHAEKAVTSVHGTRDSTGTQIASQAETAMGYVKSMTEGLLSSVRLHQYQSARLAGTSVDKISVAHKEMYNKWETEVANESDKIYVNVLNTKGNDGVLDMYEAAVGGQLKKNKKGERVEPEDLYQVVSNHIKKDLEASGKLQVPKDIKYIHEFYTKFADEGTALGKGGLAGKTAFGYAPHTWNSSALHSRPRDEVVPHIEQMLKNNPIVANEYRLAAGDSKKTAKLDKEYKEAAEKKYEDALDSDIMKQFTSTPNESGTPRSSKLRKLRVDTSLYPEYFAKSAYEEMQSYAHQMSGQLAMLKHYGLQSDKQGGSIAHKLDELKKQFIKEGATVKDVENWTAMMESVLGTRTLRRDSGKWTSYLGNMTPKVASALWSSGFSVLSLTEIGAIMAKHGVVNTIQAFIPAHKAHLDIIKGMDKNNPNLQYYINLGLSGMTLRDSRFAKFENETLVNTKYAGEQALDDINHFGRKITFFSHIQDTLDHIAGSAYMTDLLNSARTGKITDAQKSKFLRYGLTVDDIAKIKNAEMIKKDGKVIDYNFHNWTDKDLGNKVYHSLRNAVEDTIVRTDGTRIHRAQSDVNDTIKGMLLQYTMFPMAAYERLLVNFDEVTSRTLAGAAASFALSYGMQELSDAAAVQAGVKDRRADVDTLAVKAFLNTPFSSIFPSIYDAAATVAGLTTSKGYTPREGALPNSAGMVAVESIVRNMGKGVGKLMEGEYADSFANMSKVFPIANNIPLLNIAFKMLAGQQVKEHGDYRSAGNMYDDPIIARTLFKE